MCVIFCETPAWNSRGCEFLDLRLRSLKCFMLPCSRYLIRCRCYKRTSTGHAVKLRTRSLTRSRLPARSWCRPQKNVQPPSPMRITLSVLKNVIFQVHHRPQSHCDWGRWCTWRICFDADVHYTYCWTLDSSLFTLHRHGTKFWCFLRLKLIFISRRGTERVTHGMDQVVVWLIFCRSRVSKVVPCSPPIAIFPCHVRLAGAALCPGDKKGRGTGISFN